MINTITKINSKLYLPINALMVEWFALVIGVLYVIATWHFLYFYHKAVEAFHLTAYFIIYLVSHAQMKTQEQKLIYHNMPQNII